MGVVAGAAHAALRKVGLGVIYKCLILPPRPAPLVVHESGFECHGRAGPKRFAYGVPVIRINRRYL